MIILGRIEVPAGFDLGDDRSIKHARLAELGLDDTHHRMRHVRLRQRGNLVGGEFHVHGCESVVEMIQLGGTDNRSGDDRLR